MRPASSDPRSGGFAPQPIRNVVVAQAGRTSAEIFRTICRDVFPSARVTPCVSGIEALQVLRARPADLLLLEMSLPDMDGGDLLQFVTQERLAMRVIVTCHRRDERSLRTLRDARFDGLIDTLEEGIEGFICALRLVAANVIYVSPSFREIVVDRGALGLWRTLTPAEMRVFRVIGDGTGNEEAARLLGLTSTTIQTHRRNLMRKIGISTSAKLVFEAIRLGVIRLTSDGRVIRPGIKPGA